MLEGKFAMNKNRAVEVTYFLLRVVAGLLLLQAGGLILFGWFGGMPGGGSAPLMSQTGIGGGLEFFGGILIILGLFTRPVAFVLSGMMAVAYWQFHAPQGAWPIQNQGMPAVLLCFIFLHLAAQGAGRWSLDELIRRQRAGKTSAG
jgi:putative oxidoreductase